ncbi:MAG: 1-acyl-sn-glycerol-3-phosphate acyltransferase [Actinomycetia bacterium]|nr:1-acyl-sn-glycerol-3-phosphate acyltransferase [Actinomycetes bacterium]
MPDTPDRPATIDLAGLDEHAGALLDPLVDEAVLAGEPGRDLVRLRPSPEPVPPIEGERRSDVDRWGRSEHVRDVARQIYDPLYRYWHRVEWEGFEHVPTEGGALLVSNHAGAIPSDAPAIMHGVETQLGRPVYGLAENLFRAIPGLGTMWSRLGGVAAHPDNAYRLLHDEQQLALVFPEGTKGTGKHYSQRYQLHRFGRGGFVEIAMRSGVPVIPIAVVGSEEAMPILWKSNRLAKLLNIPYFPVTANMLVMGPLGIVATFPAKLRIRVLPPVHFNLPPNQERYSRARVMDESEHIRRLIQDALYDMLRTRRSVWFG